MTRADFARAVTVRIKCMRPDRHYRTLAPFSHFNGCNRCNGRPLRHGRSLRACVYIVVSWKPVVIVWRVGTAEGAIQLHFTGEA